MSNIRIIYIKIRIKLIDNEYLFLDMYMFFK